MAPQHINRHGDPDLRLHGILGYRSALVSGGNVKLLVRKTGRSALRLDFARVSKKLPPSCILTAALVDRNGADGNTVRHKLIVVAWSA